MDSDVRTTADSKWSRKDVWMGLLFGGAGILILTFAVLADSNDFPAVLLVPAWVLGPVMLLLGLNAVVRSLGASRDQDAG